MNFQLTDWAAPNTDFKHGFVDAPTAERFRQERVKAEVVAKNRAEYERVVAATVAYRKAAQELVSAKSALHVCVVSGGMVDVMTMVESDAAAILKAKDADLTTAQTAAALPVPAEPAQTQPPPVEKATEKKAKH